MTNPVKKSLHRYASAAQWTIAGWTTTIHPSPILIMGNQKSGTTAIAALLSQMTETPATLDLHKEMTHTVIPLVCDGSMTLGRFIERNRLDFSRPIIKEPALTLLYDALAERFPDSRFVMVIRDPRDNIRSILNRLKIEGDLQDIPAERFAQLTPSWMLNIDNTWLGLPAGTYVEMLSHRWNHMVDMYEHHADRSILCRYETFVKDKVGIIRGLANELQLKERRDISDRINVQYQPAGDRRISWPEFFGTQNLKRIEDICMDRMIRYGYSPTA